MYIDSDELRMTMVRKLPEILNNTILKATEEIIGLVDDTPVIDAVVARHGYWKRSGMRTTCSECEWNTYNLEAREYKRCPMCGAFQKGVF